MKSYEININSNWRAILLAIVFYGPSFYAMGLIPRGWPDLAVFGIGTVLFILPIIPVTILSRGRIRIELTDDAFRTIWLKRYFLSNLPDVELDWNRIIDYVYQPDRGLDSFRLTLTNKQQYKFYRYSHIPQKDQFNEFLTQFPVFIQSVNHSNQTSIKTGQSYFQSKSFKWVLIGLTILTLGLLINTMMNPNSGTSWAMLGILLSAIIYYWMQSNRKN